MIRFVIGQVDLEEVESLIDGVDEAQTSSQEMKGANAAVANAAGALGDFVMDIAGRQDRPCGVVDARFVEAPLQTALATSQLLSYLGVHSKSLAAGVDDAKLLH